MIKCCFTVSYNQKYELSYTYVTFGGLTKLEAEYINERDKILNGLDFELIAANSSIEKRFFLKNSGTVESKMTITCNSPYYKIGIVERPYLLTDINLKDKLLKAKISHDIQSIDSLLLPPLSFVCVRVIVCVPSTKLYIYIIVIICI